MSEVEVSGTGNAVAKGFLWLVLLVSGATNAIGQFVGLENTPRMVAGGIAVLCIVLLVVLGVRGRK